MGRSAGFIAAHATMASSDVDLCLVPDVPVVLEGEKGCLPHLLRRVKQQGYAVVVVADKDSHTGVVVKAMDQCRLAGAMSVSLAARQDVTQ